MGKSLFKVIKKGLITTFQDLGRYGYQQYGVVTSGAMDPLALQLGNIVVGNKRGEAGMEITMVGPELVALSAMTIAITGGDLSPKINGESAPLWKSIVLQEGDTITFGRPIQGIRTYLTVSGGFQVPVIMGSKSTYMKAGIGQPIEDGDMLYSEYDHVVKNKRAIKESMIIHYEREISARIIEGPHRNCFTDEGIHTFFSSTYTVKQGDRMGFRLEGPEKISHVKGADITSDAIPLGGIQVPASGQPIILMADRQTTGGYTRIGTIISEDIPKIAQLPPGGKISFKTITIEEAQLLYRKREKQLRVMEALWCQSPPGFSCFTTNVPHK
jgi:antagonist of KipI